MHDLLKSQNFETISKDEILKDLEETLKKLDIDFRQLAQ